MLPDQFRLKRMRDFEILFAEGGFASEPLLTLKAWKVNPEKYPKRGYLQSDLKIAFVVGLKVSKKAVARNRLRRQMREVVRLLLQQEKLALGYHLAFVAKKEMLGATYQEIEKNILSSLKRARLLM